MSFDGKVLRAMLRLARRHEAAEGDALAVRVGGAPRDVRASLRRLRSAGLVDIVGTGEEARLTMAGLAAAVAMLPRPAPGRRAPARASHAA